jgi:hypothetical protein
MKLQGFIEKGRDWTRIAPAMAGVISVCGLATFVGCSKKKSGPDAPGSASAAASASGPPVVLAVPVHAEKVRKAVNPKGQPAYTGPTGIVAGVVRLTGPEAPTRDEVLSKIPEQCAGARGFYGPAFREGPDRGVADVLVTVSGYSGYVPAKEEVKATTIKDCAYAARTYAVMFGQKMEVKNIGARPQMPKLLGATASAVMIAVPGGDAVPLLPDHPGRFALVDEMYGGIQADVFVLQYPTFAVTGSDGRFEIRGVPPGELKLNALLPTTMSTKTQTVKVEAGKTSEAAITLEYVPAAPAPSSSAPAPPMIP